MSTSTETDFQSLAENSADLICRCDFGCRIHYASPSSEQILGWKPEELVGVGPEWLVVPEDLPIIKAAAKEIYSSDTYTIPPYCVRMRRKNDTPLWVEISARLVRNSETGEPTEAVMVIRDVSERKALEQQLAHLALTDALTGVGNRRAFDEALDREWKRTLRSGSEMSLLLLDLDNFKGFNDHYGHQAGDGCLRSVAATLQGIARGSDVPARYGGEELALILPATDTAGALEVAEQLRLAIGRLRIPHARNPEGGLHVSASIGVSTVLARYGSSVHMPGSLLRAADKALYKAKGEGRDRVAASLSMSHAGHRGVTRIML